MYDSDKKGIDKVHFPWEFQLYEHKIWERNYAVTFSLCSGCMKDLIDSFEIPPEEDSIPIIG